jgi:hypothetical protein
VAVIKQKGQGNFSYMNNISKTRFKKEYYLNT